MKPFPAIVFPLLQFLFISEDNTDKQQQYKHEVPVRQLAAPFPDGPCGGRVVTIPPEETYAKLTPLISGVVLPPRPIDVWLPPEYDQDAYQQKQDFPVLLCHDGQNAMEDALSWTGASWRLVGALTRLSERNMLRYDTPPIVVMLPSAEGDLGLMRRRHLEYADTANPFAQAHADFCAQTVLPYVRTHFRATPVAEDVFVMGSSLGGQASLHMLLRHPDLFGGAACLSPAFQPPTLASVVAALATENNNNNNKSILKNKRLYMDIGGDIDKVKVSWFDIFDHVTDDHWWNPGYWWLDTQLQASVDAMSWTLKQGGVPHSYKKFAGARHNERAWSLRIHQPLLYLLGKQQS